MKSYETLLKTLSTLKLRGIHEKLDEVIHHAETEQVSYLGMLNHLFETEVSYRNSKRLRRNLTGAHFPIEKRLSGFDFTRVGGITKNEVTHFSDCSFIDRRENILLFGPPGIGKTHLAIGFGFEAIERGYKVCFERVTGLIKALKTADIHRTSDFRIKKILKSDLLIIDEIGYTPIDRKEANLFFTLISELYEKTSIIITSNKSFESWAEMMGDEIMTTALLDRLMHHARIFSLDGNSYRLKEKTEIKEVIKP